MKASGPPRNAALREAARQQRQLEKYYNARRSANAVRREKVQAGLQSATPTCDDVSMVPSAARRSPGSPTLSPSSRAVHALPDHREQASPYGKFDYALKRDQPSLPRDSYTGRPKIPLKAASPRG
eukprot:Sspe_Gene.41726::Locus_20193_Transcript_7_8_Confidence_0.500_Length_703::g.41726::m.41726